MPRGIPNSGPRARQTAQEETAGLRRRRTGNLGAQQRLTVDEAKLDRDRFEYRFIKDDEVRLHLKTKQDDWDVVHQDGGEVKDDATDMGTAVSVLSGTKKEGGAQRLYLCRKPKEFCEEDRRAKEDARAEVEEQMRRMASSDSAAAQQDGNFFNPSGRNRID